MQKTAVKLRRAIFMMMAVFGIVSGALAQPTAEPPQVNPMQPQLRVNPQELHVVAYVNGEGVTSALVIPVRADVDVFVPNPIIPNQYATVDSFGTFTLWTNGQGQGLPAPFTPFTPADRASNDKLAVSGAWTPDGKTLAVVIDNPERQAAEDGVYWWEIGVTGANQIMHNCRAGVPNCIYYVSGSDPYNWYATSADWSPSGENLLVRGYMEGIGYEGFLMLSRTSDRSHRPTFCRYQYSEWSPDGLSIVVSGFDENALPTLGTVAPHNCADFRQSAVWGTGWIPRNGVMRPDGTLVALARTGGIEGPYRVIDDSGNQLTGDIGFATPTEVLWNSSADAAFVRTEGGRAYLVSIHGEVVDITEGVAGAKTAAWMNVP